MFVFLNQLQHCNEQKKKLSMGSKLTFIKFSIIVTHDILGKLEVWGQRSQGNFKIRMLLAK